MILKMLVIKTCKIQQKHCLEKKSTGFNIHIKKKHQRVKINELYNKWKKFKKNKIAEIK